MRLRSRRRPNSSHSAGSVTISVNKFNNPFSCVVELVVYTRATDSLENLKDRMVEMNTGLVLEGRRWSRDPQSS